MAHRILCVDPDAAARAETVAKLRTSLTPEAEFETAGTLADAKTALGRDLVAVVTEYDLPGGTGVDLVRAVDEVAPDAGCILYTGVDPERIDTDALRGAVTEYVGKESVFGTERLGQLLRTTVEERAQATYPLPQDETERLAALRSYALDDEALNASLDRVSTLAAEHFDVDIASINIVEEHSQEFLACYGHAGEWETMDRQDSICTFTLLEDDDVMVVEDVTEDPRFASRSESLVALGVRSYMGANLVAKSGLTIGPLCVYDDEPRSFSADDRAYLRELAGVAMDLVESHSRANANGSGPQAEGWQR